MQVKAVTSISTQIAPRQLQACFGNYIIRVWAFLFFSGVSDFGVETSQPTDSNDPTVILISLSIYVFLLPCENTPGWRTLLVLVGLVVSDGWTEEAAYDISFFHFFLFLFYFLFLLFLNNILLFSCHVFSTVFTGVTITCWVEILGLTIFSPYVCHENRGPIIHMSSHNILCLYCKGEESSGFWSCFTIYYSSETVFFHAFLSFLFSCVKKWLLTLNII